MAPAFARPRAPLAALALALLMATGALASEWPPQNTSEAEGRGWEESRDPPGDPATPPAPGGPRRDPSRTPPEGCPGCAGEGDTSALPPRAGVVAGGDDGQAAVTWPGDTGTATEEPGSGERPVPASPPTPGGFGGLEATSVSPPSPQSPPGPPLATGLAGPDALPATGGSATSWTPTLGDPGDTGGAMEPWGAAPSPAPAQGADGRVDLAWLEESVTITADPAELPTDRTAAEIIDVDYYDLFEGGRGLGGGFPGGDRGGGRQEPKGVATPWGLHELYDDFTPFDEADFYPTTSFYADGDEEDELEEDEEDEEEDGGLEDENGYRPPASVAPRPRDPQPTGMVGGSPPARPRPGENGTECRSGYVRHNSSCRSLCDLVPSYCHNGGQCYLVESHGAFCRCNTQDYTWHKGTRCEAIVTDFQVMCVAVGSAALVVLLLFMLTVFFAKKLYLLKTENSKLRKTKYRTPSELHNDNFSLSTIAEGSHPNDDPSAPHKLQDSLKSCLKDEEPFNIHNSTSPKHEGGKGEQEGAELNCLQNNLT